MFAYRENSTILQASRIGNNLLRNRLWISAKRADIDNGILGIDIDIGYWGEIDLYAQFAALTSHLPAISIEEAVITDATQNHIFRECRQLLHAHGQSPLAIKGHQQRYLTQLLCFIHQNSLIS